MVTAYRALVGLDLSEADEFLISFVSRYAAAFHVDKVYFLHMARSLDIPKEVQEKYPALKAPVDESIAKDIDFSVQRYFKKNESPEIEIEVRKGSPEKGVLHWSRVKDADLIVLGVKPDNGGSGLLPDKLVKVSNCSVLLIPPKEEFRIRKICIALDFSEVSLLTFREAVAFADKIGAEAVGYHVYSVPQGYHLRGKDKDEFAGTVKENAMKEGRKFLETAGASGVEIVYDRDDENNVAAKIAQFAKESKADMLAVGSKGRTAASALLVGSAAGKLAKTVRDMPLLIVKKKNENLGFLDALIKV